MKGPLRATALFGVALLFALSGRFSFDLAVDWGSAFSFGWNSNLGVDNYLFPVPFALLSTVLFLHSWKVVISLPLNALTWYVALRIACAVDAKTEPYMFMVSLCLAGLIGALGVALSDAICAPKLFQVWPLFVVALIGAASALLGLRWFIVGITTSWQTAVGTYLYFVYIRTKDSNSSNLKEGN